MDVIHMKKPGVYKRPAKALEPGKPFRMRDPKTCEWATFIPVIVKPDIGVCSQCAFCMPDDETCSVRWEARPMEDNPMFLQFAGLCTRYVKGFSIMRLHPTGMVVFKNINEIFEEL